MGGAIAAVQLNPERPTEDIALGNYTVNIDLRRNRRNPAQVPATGYALVLNVGPDEYFVAGADVQVIFFPRPASDEIVGFAQAELGEFVNGTWKPGRRMNGDDILLRYDIAEAAAKNQSGSGLRFTGDTRPISETAAWIADVLQARKADPAAVVELASLLADLLEEFPLSRGLVTTHFTVESA